MSKITVDGLFPRDKCIHELFEQKAFQTPDAAALIFGKDKRTYRDLNEQANQLAYYLRQMGAGPDVLVAICMERSPDMFIGLLAILKAGAAYVPLDFNYPKERLQFLLEDAAAPLLLTQSKLRHYLPDTGTYHTLCMDELEEVLQRFPLENLQTQVRPDNLIYTIYTSGSTGKPKGVQIEHRSVVNLIEGQLKVVHAPVDRFLYAYSFAFDGAVLLIYWTLLDGGTLVIAPEGLEKDVGRLASFIQQQQVTHLLTFPSVYNLLLDQSDATKLQSLQSVSVAGEACPAAMVQTHHLLLPNTYLLNQYGPTEATVGATIHQTLAGSKSSKVPIGTPIDGVYVYILDEQMQALGVGQVGELYIGGKGVARGYLNRPKLHEERFLPDPFSADPQARMYRTGDLATRLPDGQIDFIGRADHQVKLRGYRIELGEVEVAILQHPALREAVVELKGESAADKKLVAYLVRKQGQDSLSVGELRRFLQSHLPAYMVPASFVFLDQLPLAASGKVDRKALPEPPAERPELEQAYAAPINALQSFLVKLWEQILRITPIGIHDRFFELGGNSLQAAQFISQLQKELNETVFIVTIFDAPTVADYAAMLERDYATAVADLLHSDDTVTKSNLENTTQELLRSQDFKSFDRLVPKLSTTSSSTSKNPPALFILAPPRSGTSLLRVMLAGHPDLFAANELQLLGFQDLKERHAAYNGKFALWKEGLVRTIMALNDCDADTAKGFLQNCLSENWSTQQMYQHLQSLVAPRLLVDKSPSYALDKNALIKAENDFEEPLYIHLVRHPYAMVSSFEKMHMDQVMYLHPHSYNARQTGELIWTCSHQTILKFLQDIPTGRHHRVVYEDLVRQPEKVMRKLCEHLKIPYHPSLIQPYQDLDQKMTDGIYQDSKPMGDVRLLQHQKINASMADKWKGVLKDNFLSPTTWQLATQLNYPPQSPNHRSPNPKITKPPTPKSQITKPHNPQTTKSTPPQSPNSFAIVGYALRVPGAETPETFWQNLVEEKDVSREFKREELLAAGISTELIDDPNYVKRGMPLKDYDCFDASFFGYHPKEAALMDPQHRVFLEVAYSALERAGYDPERYKGRIGVFGGVARNTYLVNNVLSHPNYFQSIEDFTKGVALEKDFPATRVAYKLNLKGPAVNVQTACSSSGVAIHLACQSLMNKDSDMVLVGGGRIQPPVEAGHLHTEGHALSPDGYCKAFDASAEGMVRGNGMAFIVIKRLEDAIEDKDTIHGIIRGTAINNDGSEKMGFTAPSAKGQAAAVERAYENAGISPASVSYIEAHGTGTRIGDPIEISGLSQAFRKATDAKSFCAIGSVKTNIGHLDAGACVVGTIKTLLSLKHEKIPASLHFRKPNPQIPFDQTPFFVNHQLRDWRRSERVRRAGVSSFGLGGTNAHIVLEEAPILEQMPKEKSHENQLLLLSAKSPEALERKVAELRDWMDNQEISSLEDVAYTLSQGRQLFAHRAFIIGNTAREISERLREGEQENGQQLLGAKLSFLFPGGGAQHSNMGLGLYKRYPVFRAAVDECLDILKSKHQLDIRSVLYPPDSESESQPIRQSLHAITLLFTIEYATARLWLSWGLQPTELIGHSLGEYTAACIAGVFSLEDALAMVTRRGTLFMTLPKGSMLSVGLSEKEVQPFLAEDLSIAAINKPDQCVLSGSNAAIDRVQVQLEAQEIQASRLHIAVAAHSLEVEPILESFGTFLEGITFHPPSIPIVSNVTGDWVDGQAIQSPTYWLKHLRQTVRFSEGVAKIFQLDKRILLEVGPGQTLSTFARQHPAKRGDHLVLASLRHPKEKTADDAFLLKTLGRLWLAGQHIDAVFTQQPARRIALPTYPFERKRHWIDPKPMPAVSTDFPFQEHVRHQLEKQTMSPSRFTRVDLLIEKLKDIFHQLSGIPVSEMKEQATFLEMGFDSLFLTQVTTKIKKQLKLKLSFRQLLEEVPSLKALAKLADQQLPETALQAELESRQQAMSPAPVTPTAPPPHIPLVVQQAATPPSQSIPTAGNTLEAVIQQQLRLMEQQLQLLGGNSPARQNGVAEVQNVRITQVQPSSPPPAQNGEDKRSSKNGIVQKKDGAAHGPWKPISKKDKDGLDDKSRRYLNELIQRYTERTKGSQQLAQSQRTNLADPRSITGFNKLWKDMVYQIAVERSKGSKVWDVDGHEYIDYRMAFGISLFGHSPDFVKEAVQQQLEKGFELGVNTPLAQKVADLLAELTGMERVTLVNTGSEAISAAIRAARTATGKDRIAVFEGDYHGIADEMLVRGVKRNGVTLSLPVAPGIPSFLVENVLVLDYHDPDVLKILEEQADELAAVLIEPVQPNNPHQQHHTLLHQIRELTTERDIALIFDEMITGFRVAMRGAQEWYNIEADIVAYGKILSGGLPMAAVAGKSRFMDCFDGGFWEYGNDSIPEAGVTFFGGTFVKHPLSLAASYAALSEIKSRGPRLYEKLNAKTARFAERIKELFIRTKVPLQVLSTASVVAIKVTDNNPLSRLFFFYLRLKGIHLLEKAGLVSTAHTEADLDHTLKMMEESIREMQTAGFFKMTVAHPEDQNHIVYPPMLKAEAKVEAVAEVTKKKLPLSEGQLEVWVEQQLGAEAAAAYNLSSDIRLEGPLDHRLLEKALQRLVARHEALRTYFDKSETVQYVLSAMPVQLPVLDLSALSGDNQQAELEAAREEETRLPLDLFNGPLVRFRLLRLSDELHHLFFSVHHAIADGLSVGVIVQDMAAIFKSLQKGQKLALPPAEQLGAYIEAELAFAQTAEYKKNQAYWAAQFKKGVPVLELPTDRIRPTVKTYEASIERIHIPADLMQRLKRVATAEGTTLFILLYTAFQTLMHRLSKQEEFVLGLVAAGQTVAGFEKVVAHGVSLLPVRTHTQANTTFQQHLKNMRRTILDAFDHQQYSLGALVRHLKLTRDPGRQPMISILFNMDAAMGELDFGDLKASLDPIVRRYETFDGFINVKPVATSAVFEWIYNTDLFERESIQRRLASFLLLLEGIAADPSQTVAKLPILPPSERQLLASWNPQPVAYPQTVCIQELIEKQARQRPEKIALVSGEQQLSYEQLEQTATHLAENLVARGIQAGDFVGIFFDRSVDLVVALLATLKAGAIYVPLDPANPPERLQVIMEDVQAKFVLTHRKMKEQLPAFDGKVLIYEDCLTVLNGSAPPLPEPDASAYAYINYTSGSSGRPKGVLIPHYAVIDHHFAIRDALQLDEETVVYGVASIAFDPSVQDFFLPLMLGAKIIVAPEAVKTDGFLLKEDLALHRPTLMQATPSTWRMLLAAGWQGHDRLTILSGGEGLTKELAHQLGLRSQRLYNIYGPTETTIWSTLKLLEGDRLQNRQSGGYEAVGQPINNVEIYLLDQYQQMVPIGVAGEIYVGGVGVAPEGYFRRPKLTAEKFIKNPFDPSGKSRLYRSGDMARYLSNGDLEYLHRADKQVKIRGFRIELGEVESALAQHPEVGENVVIIREDQPDQKRLVAYIIPRNGRTPEVTELKEFLQQKLPDYMLPSAFVEMKKFPMTATLKVNRGQLPEPAVEQSVRQQLYEAPKGETELLLTDIWTDLLQLPQIGVHDNFFELGGHSLIAVRMMARIEKARGCQLPLAALLEHSTIRRLAKLLDDQKGALNYSSLIAIKATGSKPPVYLVHGAGLHILMYEMLSRYMDADQPIYALQARGLDGREEPLDRIEEIAAHYIGEILQQNPFGPYAIAGYSFGGLIAFEMARQLRQMGKEVMMLGVFDTVVRQSITGQESISYYQQLSNLGKKVSWNLSLLARRPLDGLRYKSKSLQMRWKRWKYQLNRTEDQPKPSSTVDHNARVDQCNKRAFEQYRIQPYGGDLHLFRAKERRFYVNDFEFLGWRPFIEGAIKVNEIPGDHLHLFDPPHGETFARILQQTLDSCAVSCQSFENKH
ncbi:MAG: amino acid adenylation domain-containing protein [Bacteroidota bacterium]